MTRTQPPEAAEIATGSRRDLIHAAAGGFALMASGLFLTGGMDEADARNKRKGKKRDHGNKKNKNKDESDEAPRGGGQESGGSRNVAVHVHNYRSVPVQVQAWEFAKETGAGTSARLEYAIPAGWGWSSIPARAADGSHSSKSFICGRDRDKPEPRFVIVQIGTDRVAWCYNEPLWWPRAEVRSGGWSTDGWTGGGQVLGSMYFFVNESLSRDGIKITRLNDTQDHIQFTVDL